ncbi:aminotransferase class I/II-fold pyridoxal phosphate-dependent enzyme [bacterium]|nr:aminotransferase class I/II-fold pyridoxal phosphate-dependent enzyme [bacterium]
MKAILLDKNENKYGPSPKCRNMARRLGRGYFTDYTRDDNQDLYNRLSKRYNVPPDQILLGYGAEDILKQIFEITLKPRDRVLLPSHTWYYYSQLCRAKGLIEMNYPLIRSSHEFQYDYDALKQQFEAHRPKLTLICSPNNPTGAGFDNRRLEELLRLASGDQIILLDQAYAGFSESVQPPVDRWVLEYDRLVVLGTFSKYYALAGARIGYSFISRNLIQSLGLTRRWLGFSRPLEKWAIASLDSEKYYLSCARKIRQDRDKIINRLNGIPGFTAFVSEANFILVEYPPEARYLFERELGKRGIRIKFITGEPAFVNMARISVGKREHTVLMLTALDSLAKTLARGRNLSALDKAGQEALRLPFDRSAALDPNLARRMMKAIVNYRLVRTSRDKAGKSASSR